MPEPDDYDGHLFYRGCLIALPFVGLIWAALIWVWWLVG